MVMVSYWVYMGFYLDFVSGRWGQEVKKMSIIQIVIGIFATIMTIVAIEMTIQFGIFVYFKMSKHIGRK